MLENTDVKLQITEVFYQDLNLHQHVASRTDALIISGTQSTDNDKHIEYKIFYIYTPCVIDSQ